MLDLVLHKATAAVRRASGSPPRYAQSQTDKKDYFLSQGAATASSRKRLCNLIPLALASPTGAVAPVGWSR